MILRFAAFSFALLPSALLRSDRSPSYASLIKAHLRFWLYSYLILLAMRSDHSVLPSLHDHMKSRTHHTSSFRYHTNMKTCLKRFALSLSFHDHCATPSLHPMPVSLIYSRGCRKVYLWTLYHGPCSCCPSSPPSPSPYLR